jgi:hypothetical protein
VPVRIAIDKVPPGVPLVSGLTATVTIRDGKGSENGTLLQKVSSELETTSLTDPRYKVSRAAVGLSLRIAPLGQPVDERRHRVSGLCR